MTSTWTWPTGYNDHLPEGVGPDTLAVRAGLPATPWGENSEALFLTSGFVHPTAEAAERRFAGTEEAFVYSRFSNPTVAMMERRLAALEGAQACIATSSGMSAILLLLMGLLKAGDHVLCSRSMFGSTIKLVSDFARFGIEATFVAQADVSEWQNAVRPNTRLLFAETPTNPLTEVCDIAALANVAHRAGALLAVDNCFCSPALQQPLRLGADIVMHSGTKFLDGQGRVMAGALCGSEELINNVFTPVMRSAGMCLSPFNAWVVLKGMETLALRLQAQSANALQLAQWLEDHPQVQRVFYPALSSHPQHELAMRQQNGTGGAVVSFIVKSPENAGKARAFEVINALRLCSISSNLGDTKTIVTHPGTTSHGRLSEDQRLAAGIVPGMIRVAVGIENQADLRADLQRGLSAAQTESS